MNLKFSTIKLGKSQVGEIVYVRSNENIRQLLKNADFESIQIAEHPVDTFIAPNGNLVSTSTHLVTIFNEVYNEIKKFRIIETSACSLSYKNELFISNRDRNSIHKLDLSFNKLKTIDNDFNQPCGITCCKDELYICDYGNQRIQIYNLELEYVGTIKVDFCPYTIKVSDTSIGVHGDNGTYFYDVNTKVLKNQYQNIVGRINYLNSNFYVLTNKQPKKAYCYDHDGNLIEEINIDKFGPFISVWYDGHMMFYKKDLIISSYTKCQLLRFVDKL